MKKGNRNQGNGHLSARAGLKQLGPIHSTGGGMWLSHQRESASKPKTISTRVAMSNGQRRRKATITMPKLNFMEE